MTAPNTWSSMADTDVQLRFRMGPLLTESVVDYWWNTQHDDGTYTACGEPEGWESVDYITPIDQVGGRDGGLTGPQSVAPRVLEMEALIVSPTAATLRQHLAAIRRIFGPQGLPGPRQPVVWQQYDHGTGRDLALVCRPDGKLSFVVPPGNVTGGVACVIGMRLVAANPPWKYQAGDAETNHVGLLNPGLISGRTYSKTYSYTYGGGTSATGGEMNCYNAGDLPAWPVFTVTGPADFPIITNAATGSSFQINKNMGSGEVIVIDARTGQVTPSGVRLIGRPWALAPGNNTVRWRTQSSTFYADADLRLDWRSTSS